MKRLSSAREYFESFGLLGDDTISQSDFAEFVRELRDMLKQRPEPERVGAAVLAAMALEDCERAVQTDSDAELIRKGFRLGAAVASLERRVYYRAVHAKSEANLKPPPKFVSDERIREVINDPRFPTRAAQAKELGFRNVRSLQKRLEKLRET